MQKQCNKVSAVIGYNERPYEDAAINICSLHHKGKCLTVTIKDHPRKKVWEISGDIDEVKYFLEEVYSFFPDWVDSVIKIHNK